jgi:hypothetical protein
MMPPTSSMHDARFRPSSLDVTVRFGTPTRDYDSGPSAPTGAALLLRAGEDWRCDRPCNCLWRPFVWANLADPLQHFDSHTLLAQASEEAADSVWCPAGGFSDRRPADSLCSAQHGEDLRLWPTRLLPRHSPSTEISATLSIGERAFGSPSASVTQAIPVAVACSISNPPSSPVRQAKPASSIVAGTSSTRTAFSIERITWHAAATGNLGRGTRWSLPATAAMSSVR